MCFPWYLCCAYTVVCLSCVLSVADVEREWRNRLPVKWRQLLTPRIVPPPLTGQRLINGANFRGDTLCLEGVHALWRRFSRSRDRSERLMVTLVRSVLCSFVLVYSCVWCLRYDSFVWWALFLDHSSQLITYAVYMGSRGCESGKQVATYICKHTVQVLY